MEWSHFACVTAASFVGSFTAIRMLRLWQDGRNHRRVVRVRRLTELGVAVGLIDADKAK